MMRGRTMCAVVLGAARHFRQGIRRLAQPLHSVLAAGLVPRLEDCQFVTSFFERTARDTDAV